jgi:predicted ribosomally synthesized peptide with SipW-like signal peptide
MAKSRKLLAVGAVGVAAIALIGAGASATFTDEVNATQEVTAGTMNLTITNGGGGTVSLDGKTVTLPAFGPNGSTFESTHRILTVKNTGNITVKSLAFQMSESHVGTANNNALAAQTNVCIQSTDPSGGPWTEGNGPLATAVALQPTVAQNPITLVPNQEMTFSVDFYAGQDSTQCSAITSDGPNTRAAWEGYQGHAYQTPASLTNAAQGGVINPTLTFSFTG